MSVPADLDSAIVPAPGKTACNTDPHTEMFCREYRGLHALILRRVRDPQIAADILQDAIVTTLHKLRSGQIDRPECAGGHIYRVALNHLRNYRRRDRSGVSGPEGLDQVEDPAAESAVDSTYGAHWAQIVARTLSELPTARDREILVRFYLDEEEKDHICRTLGLTEAHFHRVIFRARARFRELVEQKGYRKLDLLSTGLLAACFILSGSGPDNAPAGAQHVASAPEPSTADTGATLGARV